MPTTQHMLLQSENFKQTASLKRCLIHNYYNKPINKILNHHHQSNYLFNKQEEEKKKKEKRKGISKRLITYFFK